jgi:hypothetical protein
MVPDPEPHFVRFRRPYRRLGLRQSGRCARAYYSEALARLPPEHFVVSGWLDEQRCLCRAAAPAGLCPDGRGRRDVVRTARALEIGNDGSRERIVLDLRSASPRVLLVDITCSGWQRRVLASAGAGGFPSTSVDRRWQFRLPFRLEATGERRRARSVLPVARAHSAAHVRTGSATHPSTNL